MLRLQWCCFGAFRLGPYFQDMPTRSGVGYGLPIHFVRNKSSHLSRHAILQTRTFNVFPGILSDGVVSSSIVSFSYHPFLRHTQNTKHDIKMKHAHPDWTHSQPTPGVLSLVLSPSPECSFLVSVSSSTLNSLNWSMKTTRLISTRSSTLVSERQIIELPVSSSR